MSSQTAHLERLAQDLHARAEQLREEAKTLHAATETIDAEQSEFLGEIQESVNSLRDLAGLPERNVRVDDDEAVAANGKHVAPA